jgi:hypothetical protein
MCSAIVSPRAVCRILQAQGLPSGRSVWSSIATDLRRALVGNNERLMVSLLDLQAQVSERRGLAARQALGSASVHGACVSTDG